MKAVPEWSQKAPPAIPLITGGGDGAQAQGSTGGGAAQSGQADGGDAGPDRGAPSYTGEAATHMFVLVSFMKVFSMC